MALQVGISRTPAPSAKAVGPRKGVNRRAAAPHPPTITTPESPKPSQHTETPSTSQPPAPSTNSSRPCCANPKIVTDDENGGRVCENCGAVIEGRQLVNDVGFTETSTGAPVATGTRVGQFATHAGAKFDGRGFRRGYEAVDSAEQTTQKAKNIITKLAISVRVNEVIQDEAVQVFRLCGPGSFLQGRTTTSVAVVCLYIACRRNPLDNAVLLIDLAEKTNTNVFKLGKLYTKIVDAMRFNEDLINKNNNQKIHIPQYAPESLIQRFANELEFDREKNRVMVDAVKVFKRMRRDWIAEGRRPAGVCAAAVIVGARMNNFRRTVREVVYVAKVCELTINKRLEEFKATDTGKLTVDEFRETDVPAGNARDPPSFIKASQPKKPGKRGRKRKQPEGETAAEIEGEDADTVTETDRPTKKGKGRVDSDGFAIPDPPIDPNLGDGQAEQDSEPINTVNGVSRNGSKSRSSALSGEVGQSEGNTHNASGQPNASTVATAASHEGPRKRGRPKGSKNRKMPPPTAMEAALEAEIEADVNQLLGRSQSHDTSGNQNSAAAEVELETLEDDLSQVRPNAQDVSTNPEIDPSEFEDDPEVANCLLNDEESKIKEMIWVTENKDWLYKHMHKEFYRKKRELEGKPSARGNGKKRHPRGDVSYMDRDKQDIEPREGETPEQANKRRALDAQIAMLKKRGTFSQAVDYSALADMGYDVRSHSSSVNSLSSSDRSRSGSRSAPTSRGQTPASTGLYGKNGSFIQRLNHAAMRMRQSMSPSPQLSRTARGSASPSPQLDRRLGASATVRPSSRAGTSTSPPASPAPFRLNRSVPTPASPSSKPAAGDRQADSVATGRSSQPQPPPIRNVEEEIVGEIIPLRNEEVDTEGEEVYEDDEIMDDGGDGEEDIVGSAFSGHYRANDSNEDDDEDDYED